MKAAAFATIIGLCGAALAACGDSRRDAGYSGALGGDARRGAQVIGAIGCGSCHAIPGIRGAEGLVGPPLEHFAHRSYIAGRLPNNAANLTRWLLDPPAIDPETAMPKLNLSQQQARDIVAYLYSRT